MFTFRRRFRCCLDSRTPCRIQLYCIYLTIGGLLNEDVRTLHNDQKQKTKKKSTPRAWFYFILTSAHEANRLLLSPNFSSIDGSFSYCQCSFQIQSRRQFFYVTNFDIMWTFILNWRPHYRHCVSFSMCRTIIMYRSLIFEIFWRT